MGSFLWNLRRAHEVTQQAMLHLLFSLLAVMGAKVNRCMALLLQRFPSYMMDPSPKQKWLHSRGGDSLGGGIYALFRLRPLPIPLYSLRTISKILKFILILHCIKLEQSVPWVHQLVKPLLLMDDIWCLFLGDWGEFYKLQQTLLQAAVPTWNNSGVCKHVESMKLRHWSVDRLGCQWDLKISDCA